VIEENTSDGTIALFIQGCGGDINPVRYKDVATPRDAEPLGNLLGLSTLRGYRKIETHEDNRITVRRQIVALPRADLAERINELESEQDRLLRSLRGTTLSLKTYVPLVVKYNVNRDFPSYNSYLYLHEQSLGRDGLQKLDAENRAQIDIYTANIHTMEELTRLQTNLRLLRMHQRQNVEAGKRTVDVEVSAIRIGEFVLVTFPGELTVRIGLKIKKTSPHKRTFVAGYTNGYIYYSPTAEQLLNVGGAQKTATASWPPNGKPYSSRLWTSY